MSSPVACFLGAGYSHAAGVPLAKDLFRASHVLAISEERRRRFGTVIASYLHWQQQHPTGHAEEFLGELYARHLAHLTPIWAWAVEYVCAVIASAGTPLSSLNRNPRYSNRINRPRTGLVHERLWGTILGKFENVSVITTNYDILVEQALRHKPMKRPPSPGCFYGGLPRPQLLKGAAQPFSVSSPERLIEMTGSIPIYKLHGSLSWSLDKNSVITYQDLRAAFRRGGDAAIIPPIPDKELPRWLGPVWEGARSALQQSETWIVCGYSVPEYDLSVQELLKSGSLGALRRLLILSPEASKVCQRLAKLIRGAELVPLPGLPEGVNGLAREIAASS